jgi:hypothetical protein
MPGRAASHPSFKSIAEFVKEVRRTGKVRFTAHAIEEMGKDHLTFIDIDEVLSGCRVRRATGHDIKRDTWSFELEGRTADGDLVAVVMAVPGDFEGRASIVTVWRKKVGRERRCPRRAFSSVSGSEDHEPNVRKVRRRD